MPHPAILRNLLEQYKTLLAQETENGTVPTRRDLDDVTYTLCVSTGTLTIKGALAAAQQQLDAALTDPPPTHGAATGGIMLTA
ncbi:DUF5133 domain-containing protein [Streptomyces sp. NPDC058695]|uniref:DUF5133 domain-containing protein n=1 Tax=Streptomyces sp. NPDC058695 TaxID=3346604 RepID=UPI003656662B